MPSREHRLSFDKLIPEPQETIHENKTSSKNHIWQLLNPITVALLVVFTTYWKNTKSTVQPFLDWFSSQTQPLERLAVLDSVPCYLPRPKLGTLFQLVFLAWYCDHGGNNCFLHKQGLPKHKLTENVDTESILLSCRKKVEEMFENLWHRSYITYQRNREYRKR